VADLADALLPLVVSTWDVAARRTVVHRSGPFAAVIAASCAIPVLMQPVRLAGRLHVDGFVDDLLALESVEAGERVLSVEPHFRGAARGLPRAHAALPGARATAGGAAPRGGGGAGCFSSSCSDDEGRLARATLLQLRGIPLVGPTSMQAAGPAALEAGRRAMRAALAERRRWGGQRTHAVKGSAD
jgi:predicted acylesterase/phospholipase RssA